MEKKETTSFSGKDVSEWICKKGIKGAKAELQEMAEEISHVMDAVDDIFDRHPECVAFYGITLEMKVDAHADDVIMGVCRANMGVERYRNKKKCECDGKCSFGSGCKGDDDSKKKRFEELIKDLGPEEKMMLAMLAVMGAKE